MQEVTTIKDFVDESGHGNHLFLLDELFRGTNTKERIAISKALLSWLVKSDNLVFVSTHDLDWPICWKMNTNYTISASR